MKNMYYLPYIDVYCVDNAAILSYFIVCMFVCECVPFDHLFYTHVRIIIVFWSSCRSDQALCLKVRV